MGSMKTDQAQKNILLLIADDLGKHLGCYGDNSIQTPNIDKLAAAGTKFDLAFTSTASCSASRSVIYTGLHPHQNGQYGLQGGSNHFQCFDNIESAPRLFNALGYQTGILGKVHVGPSQVFPYESKEESESRNVAWIAERGQAFFQSAKQSSRPFFLTVGYIDPHRDIFTRGGFGNAETCDGKVIVPDVQPAQVNIPSFLPDLPETRLEYAEYYKSITRLDAGIGLMLEALEAEGLADSTLVIFCSDNGPPFLNSKTTLYDAGMRLPFIVRQPRNTNPGIMNPNMISYIDIIPTLLEWAGAPSDFSAPVPLGKDEVLTRETKRQPPPKRLGRSFLPILHCNNILPENEWQNCVYGSHTFHEVQNYWPTRVLRSRRFKYHRNIAWQLDFPFASDLYASLTFEGIRNQKSTDNGIMIGRRSLKNYVRRPAEELYDLEADPQEVDNLAAKEEYRKTLEQMRQTVEDWQLRTKDLWLTKDGHSIMALERYAHEGIRIPDRFDFDVEKPGNQEVKTFSSWSNMKA